MTDKQKSIDKTELAHQVYAKGFVSGCKGRFDKNPYPIDSEEFECWDKGVYEGRIRRLHDG